MIGIYKITSPSGKIYIGQSWNVKDRMYKYKNLRCKTQQKLYNSLVKYGFDNHSFEILQAFPSDIDQQVLDNYEFFYWSQYKESGSEMMNIRDAGGGRKHSEETKEKFRNMDHRYKIGRKQSSETIEKRVSKIRGKKKRHKKGIIFTEDHKRNMSEARKRYFLNKKFQNGK